MSVSHDFLNYVIEQLSGVGGLRPKRMFGAVGFYSDEHFFAVLDDDVLYLKTDETNCEAFKARGMRQFMPDPDKEGSMAYYEVPADVLEDRDELMAWARKSVAVSAASAARKAARRRVKRPELSPATPSTRPRKRTPAQAPPRATAARAPKRASPQASRRRRPAKRR
jgi:DNA transformation protein